MNWQTVRLGEVLRLCVDAIPTDGAATYQIAGVYSWGRGLFKRGPLSGLDTTYKTFNRLHADDFVISSVKAWEGAVAHIPEEFEGWLLSPVFPTFRADKTRLDTRFLDWFCKRSSVWAELQGKAQGMGARRDTVSAARFLTLKIPLPPLDEQRRIVARVDELAAKIEGARALGQDKDKVSESVLTSYANQSTHPTKFSPQPIGDLAVLVKRPADLSQTAQIKSLGVKWWGKGPYIAEEKSTVNLRAERYEVRANDLIYNDMWARHGSVGIVKPEFDSFVASAHFPTWEVDLTRVHPPFFAWCFQAPWFWASCQERSQGSTGRNAISKSAFKTLLMPLPDLAEQQEIVSHLDALQAKVHGLRALQLETAAELEALLPSILDKAFKGEL